MDDLEYLEYADIMDGWDFGFHNYEGA